MKSNTRLDSAVFHLTPTRTRCDLIIIANEKKEKIASGFLNPFVAHLKAAQEQIEKGGYSIVLEPEVNSDAAWFTKGTLERFVRFVSTPEVLERVYTIELEILQIEEAIAIQGTNDVRHTAVEENQTKHYEGKKSMPDASNEEKAIILYEPGVHQPESKQQVLPEGNSKAQLLKVLESRKSVLQKEQGMAFARAVAAGFDIDNLAPLLPFSECFGATRLMDACKRFMDLWRKKHETGQWLEMEAPMSNQSEFPASGIMLASVDNKKDGFGNDVTSPGGQAPSGQQEYFQGQFPHPMFGPWPTHSPPGTVPVFSAYPVQGMPYYQSYPGHGPFYHSPFPASGDSQYDVGHRTGKKRLSMDDKDSVSPSETAEMGTSRTRFLDDSELIREQGKSAGRSGKKKSSKIVIQNLNYVTSKASHSAETETESDSGSESDSDTEESNANGTERIHKNSSRSSNKKECFSRSLKEPNLFSTEEAVNDGGHWQAFQNLLLKGADEDNYNSKEGMFGDEKNVKIKRRQNIVSDESLEFGRRGSDEIQNRRISEVHEVSGTISHKLTGSTDEGLLSGRYDDARGQNYKSHMESTETSGKRILSRTGDDFMIVRGGENSDMGHFSDPQAVRFQHAARKGGRETSHDMGDESFIVPFRSRSLEEVGPGDRTTIDMDSELPSSHERAADISNGIKSIGNYEPDALSLMPERGTERRPIGYDPALEYKMKVSVEGSASQVNRKKEVTNVREESKKSDKERKSKVASGALDKKRAVGPIRKEKSSKMGLLEDARARAEKLRSFKADLQKMKKEKEEADQKRLEALKLERQKRITERANSASVQTPGSSMQARKTKLSPGSYGGSKFSDSEPGASSPLQRSKIRTISLGSNDSQKSSKAGKLSSSNQMAGNRLTRSVSSLTGPRKESIAVTPDSKASMARIRRLSEPKTLSNPVTATKTRSAELVMKRKLSDGPHNKKTSSTVNLDKSKVPTPPELKTVTSRRPSDVGKKNSAGKDSLKRNGAKSILNSDKNDGKMSQEGDIDENPIVEKTVVMLQYEKPFVPLLHQGDEQKATRNFHNDNQDMIVKSQVVPDHAIVHASSLSDDKLNKSPIPSVPQVQSDSHEVKTNYGQKDAEKIPISEFGKAPPSCSEMGSSVKETSKPYVSDVKTLIVDKVPEALEKTPTKESSKGFRRLLKFGKKNHTSSAGDQSLDFDNSSVRSIEPDDKNASTAASGEVYTLKKLIAQNETPPAQKSSRHFSLFPTFRNKTSAKRS